MKNSLHTIKTTLLILFLAFGSDRSFSQASITSTTGYTVTLNVYATSIKSASNSCTYGYVYNVELKYSVTFSGTNIPASLWTLQGSVGCTPGSSFFDLPNEGGVGTVLSANNYNTASNCGSATPGVLKCNTVTIEISGPGISYRTLSFTPSNTPLEVKLTSFNAEPENNKVKLNWSTASENNNDYFTIERSADGTTWNEVKKVKGSGTSVEAINYQNYDESPLSGTSYYRLKQTDYDGSMSYSGIKSVTMSVAKTVSIYPVPNAGNTINISGITDYRNHEMTVVSSSGAVLYTTVLSKSSVVLPSLNPGVYIIQLKDKLNGEAQSLRYVKL
jgi:hypothetical protein